jgi:hypothetical protein
MNNYVQENRKHHISGKKGVEPSVEELIFIYSRVEKRSDSEILEEMQDEDFPASSKGDGGSSSRLRRY